MKKYIILLLALIILLSIAFPTSAEYSVNVKKYDSLNIDENEINQLNINNRNCQVVKKYVVGFCNVFPRTTTIEEVIQGKRIVDVRYTIYEGNEIMSYQTLRSGKAEEIFSDSPAWDIVPEIEIDYISKIKSGDDLLSKISKEIEIYNTYYFYDCSRMGSCIYYVTNMGDYVYYKSFYSYSLSSNKSYLFPSSDFVELITRVNEDRKNWPPNTYGDAFDLSYYADLSNYDINSTSFDLKAGHDRLWANNGNNESLAPSFFDNKLVLWGSVSAACVLIIVAAVLVTKHIGKAKRTEE